MSTTRRSLPALVRVLRVVAAVSGVLVVVLAGPARAQDYPDGGNDRPPPVEDDGPQYSPPGGESPEAPGGDVGAAPTVPAGSGTDSLAFTGADLLALLVTASILIGVGVLLRRVKDSPAPPQP